MKEESASLTEFDEHVIDGFNIAVIGDFQYCSGSISGGSDEHKMGPWPNETRTF